MLNFLHRLWLRLQGKDPLWIEIPATDPLTGSSHGTHTIEFVSRHSIAETGLQCPICEAEVCGLGDYRLVQHCRLGDVVRCNGTRTIQDVQVACRAYLVASPDTEHGDHLVYDNFSGKEQFEKFYRFRRITSDAAVKLKHGADVSEKAGELIVAPVDPSEADTDIIPVKKRLELEPGQIWNVDDGRRITIVRVQKNDDPVFHGWAWGMFVNEPPYEWHIDPYGKLHQSMRDPTMRDSGKLTTPTVLV